MKLADSGLTADAFGKFAMGLGKGGYDEDIENFEEGTVYLNDEQTDYIEPDEAIFENKVDDDGKYQQVQSVYKYIDKDGEVVYLSYDYTRSGSHFTDWYCQDYSLDVVYPHTKTIVEYY